MPNYGSRLSSSVYVRGIGSRVNSPAIGLYLDGIPVMSKSAFNLHNYQMSRVDVLRGPQGTLYGQNTEGGLVKMYSRNPFNYQGSDIRLSYGSKYFRNVEAAHYQKFNEHIALSLAGFYEGQNGFSETLILATVLINIMKQEARCFSRPVLIRVGRWTFWLITSM